MSRTRFHDMQKQRPISAASLSTYNIPVKKIKSKSKSHMLMFVLAHAEFLSIFVTVSHEIFMVEKSYVLPCVRNSYLTHVISPQVHLHAHVPF